VSTLDLVGLTPTEDPMWWRMPITKVMTTARGALYGGSGLAAVIAALEATTGRPLVWATAQYLSFVRMPATLDIRLATPVVGARTTQARGTVFHGDEEILTVLATLGHRDEHAHWTYAAPPDVPGPDDTRRQVVAEAAGTIHDILDMRIVRGVSRRQLLRGKPPVETGGRAAYWVRLPHGPHVPDAAELALVGDLVPSAFPSATGLPISGSSLDNTIRTGGWCRRSGCSPMSTCTRWSTATATASPTCGRRTAPCSARPASRPSCVDQTGSAMRSMPDRSVIHDTRVELAVLLVRRETEQGGRHHAQGADRGPRCRRAGAVPDVLARAAGPVAAPADAHPRRRR